MSTISAIGQLIVSKLSGISSVSTNIGNNIFADASPLDKKPPLIVYTIDNIERIYTKDG